MIKPLNGMLASPEATSSAKEAQLCVLPCLPMLAHLSICPSVRPSVRLSPLRQEPRTCLARLPPTPCAMVLSPVRIPVVPQYHGVPRVSPLPGGG